MHCINDKKRLYKIVMSIGTIAIMFLILLINMLYSHYKTIKEHINGLIKFTVDICKGIFELINNTYLLLGKVFNNRELAIAFWIIVFIIYFLSIKSVRKLLPNMIKNLSSKKLVIWYFGMVSYFLLMILILIRIGFWNSRLLKDTIIWFVTVGIITSGKAIGKVKDLKYFINIIRDNIKFLIIIQFSSNLYSFPFIVEVILVFVIAVVSMLIAIIDVNPQYKDKNSQKLKGLLNVVLAIIAFCMLYHSIKLLIVNVKTIDVENLSKQMLLPTILSIMFIFCTYFFVIYAAYEQLFIMLRFNKSINNKSSKYLSMKILMFCNINIIRINNFIIRSQIMNGDIGSRENIKKLLENYKAYKKDSSTFIT